MKLLIFFMAFSFSILCQTTRYVDPNATGTSDGLSWRTAWKGFHEFDINNHSQVPPGTTILVAEGTYCLGHSSYGSNIVVKISNNHDITIRPGCFLWKWL